MNNNTQIVLNLKKQIIHRLRLIMKQQGQDDEEENTYCNDVLDQHHG